MSFPSRRTFLQTAVAAVASFFLPRGLRAGENSRSFWFLAHAHRGILARGRSRGLVAGKRTAADPWSGPRRACGN